jgi:hypothetical protein
MHGLPGIITAGQQKQTGDKEDFFHKRNIKKEAQNFAPLPKIFVVCSFLSLQIIFFI